MCLYCPKGPIRQPPSCTLRLLIRSRMASHIASGVDKGTERTTLVAALSPHSVRQKLSADMIMCTAARYVAGPVARYSDVVILATMFTRNPGAWVKVETRGS